MAMYGIGGSVLTRSQMGGSKTQFYGGNGTGRDTYIYADNGGFCPTKQATTIEELGKGPIYNFCIALISGKTYIL